MTERDSSRIGQMASYKALLHLCFCFFAAPSHGQHGILPATPRAAAAAHGAVGEAFAGLQTAAATLAE